MAELTFGPSPARDLAQENNWSMLFAEKVLDRHARVTELPLRRPPLQSKSNDIIDLSSARKRHESRRGDYR